jgi:hypothetical protein
MELIKEDVKARREFVKTWIPRAEELDRVGTFSFEGSSLTEKTTGFLHR